MKLRATALTSTGHYFVSRINGATDEGQPFVAFVLSAEKSAIAVRPAHAPERKAISRFVADSGALAGINGGFYVPATGVPLDWFVVGGRTITGLTNRNRPCIYFDGDLQMGTPAEARCDVMQAGPFLLRGGGVVRDYADYVVNARQFDCDITSARFPRTVLGVGTDRVFMIVVDGRSPESAGLFLHECGELAKELGATDAINLDGGGSSALVAGSTLFNNPRSSPEQLIPAERPVPTALLLFERYERKPADMRLTR